MSVYTFHEQQRKKFLGEFLDEIVSVPDSPGERWFNRDLGRLGQAELELERSRLRLRTIIEPRPHWWLLQRLTAVEKELLAWPTEN